MPQTAKRITKADMEEVFVRMEKDLEETRKEHRESMEDIRKVLRESMEDTRRLKESIEETKRSLRENMEETRKSLNETIGGLGNTLGSMSESMLVPSLVKKFKQLGFKFEVTNRRRKIESDEHEIITEVDAFLENTTQAMAVEVKTTLKRDEVDYHVERMGKIRRHADLHNDKRQFFGAMAATTVDDETRRYTLNQGFYLIEPLGEDVMIVKPKVVKAW